MNLIHLFVSRPIGTTLLTLAILIGGVLGYLNLPVADLPNVDFPVIVVTANQPGGSPAEIASTVAAPLERHLGAISGVTEMTSQSMVNQTRITLQFDLSRDINGAARDVASALQGARQDLPTTLRSNPSYNKANSNGPPVMAFALTSTTHTPEALYDYASNVLVQQLSQVDGVGEVDIRGSALPAVRVDLSPFQLFHYGIGFEDIRAALASANAHTPKGFIDAQGQRLTLATNDQAIKAAEYQDLIIAYRNALPVRLSDVASITDSVEDIRQAGFFNGQRAIICTVFSQGGANVIHTVDSIHQRLEAIRATLPGDTQLHLLIDRSKTIRSSLNETKQTLIIAVVLVIGVVLLFLRSGSAILVPAIVVPVSIIGTFGAMLLLNYQLDNMSLMALTIATGFVVDDAIVVLENITRYMEMGHTRIKAAILGTSEVAFTVLSITVSLVVVFAPIFLMGGITGRLFHEFAMTMVVTLGISLVLSLTLTPMLSALVLNTHTKTPKTGFLSRISQILENALNGITSGYAASLGWCFRHQRLVALSLPATIILAGILFVRMPKGFFPSEDTGQIMGRVVADQSISFHALQMATARAMRSIAADPDVEGVMGGLGGRSSNSANVFIGLKPKSERQDSLPETIARITRHFGQHPSAQLRLMAPGSVRMGARSGDGAYQYTLKANSAEELFTWVPRITAALSHIPSIMDVSSDAEQGGQAIAISLDRDTEARYGITPQLISNALYDAFGQRAASVMYKTLNQYRVVMGVAPDYMTSPSMLNQMWVSVAGGTAAGGVSSNNIRVRFGTSTTLSQSERSYLNSQANALAGGKSASSGAAVTTSAETMVPLMNVARQRLTNTALTINHDGQSVAVTISFNLAPGAALGPTVTAIDAAMAELHVPPTIQGGFAGNAAAFQKSTSDEPLLILAALAAVYIVLGVLYESLIHPLTILSTLPSAGVGALVALRVAGEEFSLMAMIGVILLIGIVKKNAIMLVDFALDAQRKGATAMEAIHQASLLRFRPILMTSLAAALGALPLILGNGYGSELRHPLGIAILGGLMVSQLLTLYTTPIVFLILERLGGWIKTLPKRLFSLLHLTLHREHHTP
ncbi:multidrug efflux pump acriflavin resistance protein AcrB/AcrD/AcrF [Neokomagataea thailandica NBRC 106555]|uniref:Nodulation protein n=2 Tax=Neokomagataea TaxID=1223423 RepID=A0A4Y6V5M9_9PROT|nr:MULTISPECIES: efflux RND transporter permease subunit [Neokomagataea]QDH24178.1 nodulation protein [Neokomagataea tanensis]GBR50637.1 multidrug efflux pump acriflavin resistance protein AcrB/AcrD/AcrF [Neokomagataea thailandica NBRC 106555]